MPLLLKPLFSSIQLSASAAAVMASGQAAGGVIVHVWVAGSPVLPASSVARTSNVCAPAPSPLWVTGLVHGAQSAPSSRHSNRSAAAAVRSSEPSNVKRALGLFPSPGRSPIAAVGAFVSGRIVHARLAGAPVLPASSVARTSKVCGPAASPAAGHGARARRPVGAVEAALEAKRRDGRPIVGGGEREAGAWSPPRGRQARR